MTDGKATVLVTGKKVMGVSVDPSRGELYFANQGAGEENGFAGSAIEIIDYAGSNVSVVHDLEDYGLEPYSVECDPAFVIVDFNADDPGILLFTAHDGTEGFIYQANLFGGLLEKVYTTTTLDIFGIILDSESSMMWWIEHRGVANGVYNAMLEDTPEATYVTYLEESYWLAAVWDYDLMYTTDYKEGIVYEMQLSQTAGEFDNIVALSYATKPRCLGFYYDFHRRFYRSYCRLLCRSCCFFDFLFEVGIRWLGRRLLYLWKVGFIRFFLGFFCSIHYHLRCVYYFGVYIGFFFVGDCQRKNNLLRFLGETQVRKQSLDHIPLL